MGQYVSLVIMVRIPHLFCRRFPLERLRINHMVLSYILYGRLGVVNPLPPFLLIFFFLFLLHRSGDMFIIHN